MTPKPPAPPAAVRMPAPDDPDIANSARIKRADEERNKRGRDSTNLTGTSYARTTLG